MNFVLDDIHLKQIPNTLLLEERQSYKLRKQSKSAILLADLQQTENMPIKVSCNTEYLGNEENIKEKIPSKKPKKEIQKLLEMVEKLPFFLKYAEDADQEVLLRCCEEMKLKQFEEGETIFKIGAPGDNFYLIIEGEVNVYAKSPQALALKQQEFQKNLKRQNRMRREEISKSMISGKEDSNSYSPSSTQNFSQNQINMSQESKQNKFTSLSIYSIGDQKYSLQQNKTTLQREYSTIYSNYESNHQEKSKSFNYVYNLNKISEKSNLQRQNTINQQNTQPTSQKSTEQKKVLMLVKKLSVGESFGEMALIYSRPRLATIKCATKCLMAVLCKDQFCSILKEYEEKKIIKITYELKQIPLFSTWDFEGIQEIYLNSQIVQYKRGDIVFSKGDFSDAVYFIQTGEFNINNTVELHQPFDPNQSQEASLIPQLMKKKGCIQISKEFTIAKMCVKEMFGEEDIIQQTNRRYKVECSSCVGSLFKIQSLDFQTRVLDRSESTKKCVLDRMQVKQQYLASKEKNLKDQYFKFKDYLLDNSTGSKSPVNKQDSDLSQKLQNTLKEKNKIEIFNLRKIERRFNALAWREEDFIRGQGLSPLQEKVTSNFDNLKEKSANKIFSTLLIKEVDQKEKQYLDLSSLRMKQEQNFQKERLNKSAFTNRLSISFEKEEKRSLEKLNKTRNKDENDDVDEFDDNQDSCSFIANKNKLQSKEIKIELQKVSSNKTPFEIQEQTPKEISILDKLKQQQGKSNQKKQNNLDELSNPTMKGYFHIKISKRRLIMMSNKYNYENYLNNQINLPNKDQIPFRRVMEKVIQNKVPLFTNISLSPLPPQINRARKNNSEEKQSKGKKFIPKLKLNKWIPDINYLENFNNLKIKSFTQKNIRASAKACTSHSFMFPDNQIDIKPINNIHQTHQIQQTQDKIFKGSVFRNHTHQSREKIEQAFDFILSSESKADQSFKNYL